MNYASGLKLLGLSKYKDFEFIDNAIYDFDKIVWLDETKKRTKEEIENAVNDYMILSEEIRTNEELAAEYKKFDSFKKDGLGNQIDAIYKGFKQLEEAGVISFNGYTREWLDFIDTIKNSK